MLGVDSPESLAQRAGRAFEEQLAPRKLMERCTPKEGKGEQFSRDVVVLEIEGARLWGKLQAALLALHAPGLIPAAPRCARC